MLFLKSNLRFVVSMKPGVDIRIGEQNQKGDRNTNHNPNIFSGVVYFKKLAMLWDWVMLTIFNQVENKFKNLVYLGILVHTQCKIVHTLNSCLGRTYYSVISFFFATKSSATKTPHLNYLNYINYLPNYLPKEPPGPSKGPPGTPDPPAPHPTLTT